MPNPTAIVGLGNIAFKDEGAGIHALRFLKEHYPDISADLIEAGTPGFSLFDLMKQYQKVIFLDAVNMGKPPGTIGKFSANEAVAFKKSFSLHEMGLAEVIKLGQSLGKNFTHVTIFGMQPQVIAYGEELSASVRASIPDLTSDVVNCLGC